MLVKGRCWPEWKILEWNKQHGPMIHELYLNFVTGISWQPCVTSIKLSSRFNFFVGFVPSFIVVEADRWIDASNC